MRLLLDTNVLLWALAGRGLARPALAKLADPDNGVTVSAASAWEISIKRSLGKLRVPDDLEGELARTGFDLLPISVTHGLAAGDLPRHHGDPFDRMLVAQARSEGLTIVTRDPIFDLYDVPVIEA